MITVQSTADPDRDPSWASLAVAETLIVSPTFHVNDELGAVIETDGGVLPTAIWWVVWAVTSFGSVTVRRAVYVPGST